MVPPRSRASRRVCAILVLAIALTKARAGSPELPLERTSSGPSQSRRPQAINVRDGRSSFDITDSPALVIVSALSRARGPFPIRLVARSSEKPRPVDLAPEAVARLPKLDFSKLGPAPSPVSGLPPESRTFHLLAQGGDVSQSANYLAVEGQLRAVGRRIQVYVDRADRDSVEASTLRDLVTTFDESIYPDSAARFGPAVDVDRDGRFTVLFSSWLTRLAGGKVSVDGFVRGADLDPVLDVPFGNRCDMMYLSTSLKAGPYLRTIVAHEYTHAVTYSRKALAKDGSGLEEEGWLDEALAHLVEDSHGFSTSNIDYRVSAFLSRPESYRLVVDDYYAAELFRSHGNRGATYLFMRWCVDRYGPGLVDVLIRSELRGIASLEAATGSSFADLFRKWTVSLFLSGLDPASSPEAAYRSIDPRGKLEEWILAGPRASSVSPRRSADSWLAEGTTTHYALVQGFPPGTVSIDVTGPAEAEIQVTLVPLPNSLGRPQLKVRPQWSSDGVIRVRAEVTEQDGTPVRLGALSWEPLVPSADPRGSGFRRGGLDMLGIASAFGTSALPAKGKLGSRVFPLAGFQPGDGPVVFKAVGTDARGRRVAAWTIVSPTDRADNPENDDVEDFDLVPGLDFPVR